MPRTDWSQTWLEYHVLEDKCNHQQWCRLHWYPGFDHKGKPQRYRYPYFGKLYTSRFGWVDAQAVCGPGAYLPKRAKKEE